MIIAEIPVGINLLDIVVNAAGTNVYMASFSGSTSAINTATNTVTDTIGAISICRVLQ